MSLSENQKGFRKGYSTLDNIFTLHALIEFYFAYGKKNYTAHSLNSEGHSTPYGGMGFG